MNDFRFELIMMEVGFNLCCLFLWNFFLDFFMNFVEYDIEDDE